MATTEDSVGIMTEEERDDLGARLIDEYLRHVHYVRASTVLISLLPILYGIVTFFFGDAIWASSRIYRTALEVPGAPQSWGTIFMVLGFSTIVLAAKRCHLAVTVSTILTSVVLASFMTAFLIESVRSDSLVGVPPGIVYGIFSVAFLNRAGFAWSSFRSASGWLWPWERHSE